MPHDRPRPITLTLEGCAPDLQVASLYGQEALNEPWRYVIDLISRDTRLDIDALAARQACLDLATGAPVIPGTITQACQIHAGAHLGHYRITLEPDLQRLAGPVRQRAFRHLNVPQVITAILTENGFGPEAFRFEPLQGIYPARALCMQHAETDLHLLRRLCEEEGIHFHFEGRQVVFADDAASFAERARTLFFSTGPRQPAGLVHLAEHLALPDTIPAGSEAAVATLPDWIDSTRPPPGEAINQGFDDRPPADAAWQLQRRARHLERLRCAATPVRGRSHDPTLGSGQVVRIGNHPQADLNDHWLLTRLRHCARQISVFEGCDPYDIGVIVPLLASDPGLAHGQKPEPCPEGYANHFEAIRWTQPFRPPLRHRKPRNGGVHGATLSHEPPDSEGRLLVHLDGLPEGDAAVPALLVPGRIPAGQRLLPGDRVLIACLDQDPEQLAICALAATSTRPSPPSYWLDGQQQALESATVVVGPRQHLRIEAHGQLALYGSHGRLTLTANGVLASSGRPLLLHQPEAPVRYDAPTDLRLGSADAPLADTPWYIVRMAVPGLEHLSTLGPEDILFEGRSSPQGFLGLTAGQLQHLAVEYARIPQQLCLIYPDHCITLLRYLHREGDDSQHQAWLRAARQASATGTDPECSPALNNP